MKPIASFTVDHLKLLPGVYVSRKDKVGENIITTFDLRMTRPNYEPVMDTAPIHTIEHIGAVFLRNHDKHKDDIVYFGPMGCRTGFYLIMSGDLNSPDIVDLIMEMFEYIRDFDGDIPGASPECCGNFSDMDLPAAKRIADRYIKEVREDIGDDRMYYDK